MDWKEARLLAGRIKRAARQPDVLSLCEAVEGHRCGVVEVQVAPLRQVVEDVGGLRGAGCPVCAARRVARAASQARRRARRRGG